MDMKLVGLFGVAVMLTALLFQTNPMEGERDHGPVFPDLKQQLSTLKTVSIVSPIGESVVLAKQDDTWVLKEKSGFPVDFAKLSGFLVALAELELAEEKTSLSSNHTRLGVTESAGTTITITPGDQSLLVGNDAPSRGSFVRYPDDNQVYLTNEKVKASGNWLDWVDPVVINLESANVQEVSISTRSARFLSGKRDEESGDFKLIGMPEGRELRYETITDTLTRVLVNLRMLDVAPYNPDDFKDPSNARFVLLSGETVEVATIIVADHYWMHIGRGDLTAWQFEIAEHTYNELNKNMEDFLKPVEVNNE